MIRRPPRSTRTHTRLPSPTLFRSADDFLRAIAHRGFGFAASAGDGPGDAVHHLGEVVEKAVFALHVHIPSSGMSPCCPLRRHLIWVLAAAGTRVSASGLR